MRQKHRSSSCEMEDEKADRSAAADKKYSNGTADKVVVKQNGQITKSILKTIPKRSNSKKSKKEPTKKKNRVIFNESLNTAIDADYVILVREEDEYDYECSEEITCTCNMRPVEREMVRIDRNGGGQFDLSISDQCTAFEPPLDFVDQVTLSPPEGYKDGNSHFYYHHPARSIAARGQQATQEEIQGEESGSESSLDARSEDDELTSPSGAPATRSRDIDVAAPCVANSVALLHQDSNQQGADADDPKAQQRYIVETITMTTVTERRIVREADDTQKRSHENNMADTSQLSGILKGGKQWKSDKIKGTNADHEEVTSFASPVSPDDSDYERRNVRFTRDSEGTQTDGIEEDEQDSSGSHDNEKLEQPSPDSTELTLTFKLGNHVLVANSLNPNSAVRQLFPAQRFPSPNQKLPHETEDAIQENGDVNKATPQQYLVTSESLKLFEESKRAKVANYFNNQESNMSNGMEDDVPVNTNLIKRTIERNTLRRSLLRYEPGRHKRCMKRHDENSLVERIKQLTCDVDEPVNDYGEVLERSSPTGEESKPNKMPSDNALQNNLPSPSEIPANGVRYTDKSLSPSSSSSSGSTASTYKKLTDLFARRNERNPQEQLDQMNATHEYVDYSNSVYLSPPDLGNGLPLHQVTPPKDFGMERGGQHNFVSPRSVMTKTSVTSEARKQFLSTLAPLTACVGAGIGNGGEDGDYYHVSPGMLPLNLRTGDRTSVASTNTESGYSLNDIDEVLEDDNTQPQPDLVAGTQSNQSTETRPPVPTKSAALKAIGLASKGPGCQGNSAKQAEVRGGKATEKQANAQKVGAKATAAQGNGSKVTGNNQKGSQAHGAASANVGVQVQETTDELALFAQQDASRTERIKKRYSLNSSPPNNSDDENDDYGFNRRPSVRGIKPRFGSTEEIMQQMQSQMQPPAQTCNPRVAGHASWPYQIETPPRKCVPVRSPQMPCVQEENVVYYANYNGNNGCANQNFVAQQGCAQHHAHTSCGHQGVGCIQHQMQTDMKDAMGRKYVSNSMIYASTGNLYENQNQIMRIGGGCGDTQVYGSLGVRYLHHQTHLQHPGTSSSPPPPGVHRDYPSYNGGTAIQLHEGLPPCMHQDPRFSADMQNCQHHNKERRFSGEVLPMNQKEPRYAGESVPNQKEMRYSGEGLPTAMPNCNHLERFSELALTSPDPRYYQGEINTNQRHAGVGEGVPTQYPDPANPMYQDPRTAGIQSLDRNFAARRCPNVIQQRVSPTTSTQTQQYQTTVSSTSVRMAAPFPDPNMTAIIDPHYSSYRPPNPPLRVSVGQQPIKVPYGPGPPVQAHLMARGVRGDSPQRCGSPIGTPTGIYPQQCIMARGTQTTVQQSYQGRGYYGQVAGEHVGEGCEVYQEVQGGMSNNQGYQQIESGQNQQTNMSEGTQVGLNEKNQNYDNSGTRLQQTDGTNDNQSQIARSQQIVIPQRTTYQNQANISPTKYSTERGVPEGAASVPNNFPQDTHYSSSVTNAATSPSEPTNQLVPAQMTSVPGVYYAMNV